MRNREVEYTFRVGKNVPDNIAWCTCLLFGNIMSAMNPDPDLAGLTFEAYGKKINPHLWPNSPENKRLVELMKDINYVLLSVGLTNGKDVYLVTLELLKDYSPTLCLFPGEEDRRYESFSWKYELKDYDFKYICDVPNGRSK